MERNFLSLTVQDHFGVLAKVAALFGRRGCNIHSLTVSPVGPGIACMRMTVYGQCEKVVQTYRQLHKLEDVISVHLMTDGNEVAV